MPRSADRERTQAQARLRQRLRLDPERVLPWALGLALLLIALPVFVGLGRSVVDLVGTSDPYVGDFSGTDLDAHAVYLGLPLYGDPDSGYSPQPYVPLFALLWAGLDHFAFWRGWGPLIAIASDFALIAMAAWLAYRPRDPSRREALLSATTACAAGALAFWLVAFVPFNFLFVPRLDNPSWALALGGLLLLPGTLRGSSRATVGAFVLLSLAFWMKQSAVFASVAAVLWLGIAAAAHRTTWRRAIGFALGLLIVNGGLFAVLAAASDGWIWTFLVTMGGRHAVPVSFGTALHDLWTSLAGTLLLLGLIAGGLALGRWRPRKRELWLRWPGTRDGEIALALGLFLAVDLLPAVMFRRVGGAVHNQYLGLAWALTLLLAMLLARARYRPAAAGLGAAGVLALFVLSESEQGKRSVHDELAITVPRKYGHAFVLERPRALEDWARTRRVYHPVYTDIGVTRGSQLYQSHENVQQLLASGYQPGYLLRALLDRRFDAIFLLEDDAQREIAAGTGTWEDNYVWKLNQIVREKYRPARGVPAGVLRARRAPAFFAYDSPGVYERRAGPDPAPWIRDCFAPFRIGSITWQIRRGGGFWCRPGGRGSVLRLRRTPALTSELRSDEKARWLEGLVEVALPRTPGRFELRLGRYAVGGERAGDGMRLVVSAFHRRSGERTVQGARVRLLVSVTFEPTSSIEAVPNRANTFLVRFPLTRPSPLSFSASDGSDARVDLGQVGFRR